MRMEGKARLRSVIAVVVLVAASVPISMALSGARTQEQAVAAPALPSVNGSIASLERAFESVADNVGRSVVTISVRAKEQAQRPFGSPFGDAEDPFKNLPPQFREFFRGPQGKGKNFFFFRGPDGEERFHSPDESPPPPGPKPYSGMGSGFIIRKDGHILTNAHVVRSAEEIDVRLADGTVHKAKLVGRDDIGDVAVIKAEATRDLPTVTLGNSDAVRVGQFAVAVGNPMGLKGTVSLGIVSGINRSLGGGLRTIGRSAMIQTDAHITFGNSGGPLCNLKGEIIGINTMITREGGMISGDANSGFGFAIPINEASKVADQLISQGKVSRGYLGVSLRELDSETAEKMKANRGVLVVEVHEGSPGDKAGVKKDDVILKVNGKDSLSMEEVQAEVRRHSAGERLTLTLLRDSKTVELTATLGELPAQLPPTAPRADEKADEKKEEKKVVPKKEKQLRRSTDKSDSEPAPKSSREMWRGLGVQDLDDAAREYYKLGKNEQGALVSVVEDGSPAALASVEVGDVVKELNRQPVTSAKDFERLTKTAESKPAMLHIKRDGKTRLVTVK